MIIDFPLIKAGWRLGGVARNANHATNEAVGPRNRVVVRLRAAIKVSRWLGLNLPRPSMSTLRRGGNSLNGWEPPRAREVFLAHSAQCNNDSADENNSRSADSRRPPPPPSARPGSL